SIMPGKVNPTQVESLTMVCTRVFGNNSTITFAASQGHLELNVLKPVVGFALLESTILLADGINSFVARCVDGIEADEANIKRFLDRSLMLVTALAPKIGYDAASKIARAAHKNGTSLKEEALASGQVTEVEFDEIVRPEKMLAPSD
ncbi:MAG: class II fumarate hydratase, partial [Methylocystis sp.]|nr:class II fumarate hydratase [Methylocystis sp.]